ncbi:MAG: phosphocholine cytidylyltransferase family protein, partial [Candidatus Omnitrophota bacterium]
TQDKPKCCLSFLGKTLLARQVENFKALGIEDINVVTGYQTEAIDVPGIKKINNVNFATTNMVESLFCTRSLWNGPIIVSYGDIMYEKKVLEALIKAAGDINVVVDTNGADYFRARFGENFLEETESLIFSGPNTIASLGAPRPARAQVQGQYIGLLKFTKAGTDTMGAVYDADKPVYWDKPWLRSKNFQNGYMTDMVQRIIDKGHRINSVNITGGWLEFDSDKDYRTYLEWQERGVLVKYWAGG